MTYRPDNNEIEIFQEELSENMEFLAKNVDKTSDPVFAESLCSYYTKYDRLSSKQLYRATQFWREAMDAVGPQTGGTVIPQQKQQPQEMKQQWQIDGAAITKLIARFDEVFTTKHIQYPAFKYHLKDGIYLRFYRTGEKSRTGIGNISLTLETVGMQERGVVGTLIRLPPIVQWEQAGLNNDPVQQLVKRIVENFTDAVAINGKAHSKCCFCGLPLDNHISIYHGYGPICAENWGLPWEGDPEKAKQKKVITELDFGL